MKASRIACCFLLLPLLLSQAQGSSRKLATMGPPASSFSAPENEKTDNGGIGNVPDTVFDAKVAGSARTAGKREEKEESFRVKTEEKRGSHEAYPDVVDIAGMDYSPAKRKPPIHN